MPDLKKEKKLIDEIPLIRAFWSNKSLLEGVDKAAVDLCAIAGMIAGMKVGLPSIFDPMEMSAGEMDSLKNQGEMLTDMSIKMYGGGKAGEWVYKTVVRPGLKQTAKKLNQYFPQEGYGMTLLKGIPLAGKFIAASEADDANWKNIIGRGLSRNTMEIGMAVTGAAAMQGASFVMNNLLPVVVPAPVAMTIEIGAMVVGMTVPMVVSAAGRSVFQCAASLFHRHPDREPLLQKRGQAVETHRNSLV